MQAGAVKADPVRSCHVATGLLLPFGWSILGAAQTPQGLLFLLTRAASKEGSWENFPETSHFKKKMDLKKAQPNPKANPPLPSKPLRARRQTEDAPSTRKQSPSLPRARQCQVLKHLQAQGRTEGPSLRAQPEPGQPPPASSPAHPRLPSRTQGRKITVQSKR